MDRWSWNCVIDHLTLWEVLRKSDIERMMMSDFLSVTGPQICLPATTRTAYPGCGGVTGTTTALTAPTNLQTAVSFCRLLCMTDKTHQTKEAPGDRKLGRIS